MKCTEEATPTSSFTGGCSTGAIVGDDVKDVLNLEASALRSRYFAVRNLINGEKDDIGSSGSDKFKSIINEVESLHRFVKKPREQVADADTLLDIARSLVSCVKTYNNDGISISSFINSLHGQFQDRGSHSSSLEYGWNSIDWKSVGRAVPPIFVSCYGCRTMIGPINKKLKTRKRTVRKWVKPTERSAPKEDKFTEAEQRNDTDKNMATMFNILRKHRCVKLENLILHRNSFAETVENLFALSFLVKDGRADIKINEKGWHLVSPRNAPAASSAASGEVAFGHFVFRFDFTDWKLMASSVTVGKELMPNRGERNVSDAAPLESQRTSSPIPNRRLSRKREPVFLEEATGIDSSPKRSCHIVES